METQIQPTEMSQGENDLRQLTSTIKEEIGKGADKNESLVSSAFIYRVPEYLRKLNESAYTPRLIAIGPLHRKDKHLQTSLQHVKMSYTNYLLSRLTRGMEDLQELAEQTKFTVLQKCLGEMKTSIDDAKKYYAEDVALDEVMLLVDGCFILEFLCRLSHGITKILHFKKQGERAKDPIFGNSLNFYNVMYDLVLLENQIPFFVLEKLFPLTVGQIPDNNRSLTDYLRYYSYKMRPVRNSNNSSSAKTWCSPGDCVLRVYGSTTAPEDDLSKQKKTAAEVGEEGEEEEEEEEQQQQQVQSGNTNDQRTSKYYHILHNLHDGYLPFNQRKQKKPSGKVVRMPSASELVYAGVKFVPDDSGSNLFEIKFIEPKGLFWWCCGARFVIPPLTIYSTTEFFLRNLIALEQCCPGVSEHVSSYAWLMDMLVDDDKDVLVLEKAGVLRNHMGPTKDATDLFNKLGKEITLGHYFNKPCRQANEYSKRFWARNMAHLRRTYLASPWTFIAFCIGVMAFVMSFVEFVRSFDKKG
ncbi:UPF0481 protein At3g47200-like [Rhododendron vialii]|uniref:UPF0481 protein At3g47200-like n=1 Tax=Rhododendron vialii TaxID=182163 RepID=UPI00265EAAE0|nr:UPF0481 protein At3g47200-like [Rhododendron vialii]